MSIGGVLVKCKVSTLKVRTIEKGLPNGKQRNLETGDNVCVGVTL